jgi:hypothetical protein
VRSCESDGRSVHGTTGPGKSCSPACVALGNGVAATAAGALGGSLGASICSVCVSLVGISGMSPVGSVGTSVMPGGVSVGVGAAMGSAPGVGKMGFWRAGLK